MEHEKDRLEELRETYEVEVLTYGAGDDLDTERASPSDDRNDEFANHGAAVDSAGDRAEE